jgi:hypothetical protein
VLVTRQGALDPFESRLFAVRLGAGLDELLPNFVAALEPRRAGSGTARDFFWSGVFSRSTIARQYGYSPLLGPSNCTFFGRFSGRFGCRDNLGEGSRQRSISWPMKTRAASGNESPSSPSPDMKVVASSAALRRLAALLGRYEAKLHCNDREALNDPGPSDVGPHSKPSSSAVAASLPIAR